jgi:hypothetical protein
MVPPSQAVFAIHALEARRPGVAADALDRLAQELIRHRPNYDVALRDFEQALRSGAFAAARPAPPPPGVPPMWAELACDLNIELPASRSDAEQALRAALADRHFGDRRSLLPWQRFVMGAMQGAPSPGLIVLRRVLAGHGLPPVRSNDAVFGGAVDLRAPAFVSRPADVAAFSQPDGYLAALAAFGEPLAEAEPTRVAELVAAARATGFAAAVRDGAIRDNRDIVRTQDRRELAALFAAELNDGRAHRKLDDVDVVSREANDRAVDIARRQVAAWEAAPTRVASVAANEAQEQQRARLVRGLDDLVAREGVSLVAWWARELRRHLAPEADAPSTPAGGRDVLRGGWVHPLAAKMLTELGVDLVELARETKA